MAEANEKNSTIPVAIRDSALNLFSEFGFHGTGIRQIAKGAGVALASLYHYMGTKEDLLLSLMKENIYALLEGADADLKKCTNSKEKMRALISNHISIHVKGRMLAVVSDTELRSLHSENRAEIIALRDEYEQLWKTVIAEGIADGEFKVKDQNLTSKVVLDMCTGPVHWYKEAGPVKLEEFINRYVSYCFGALGADCE